MQKLTDTEQRFVDDFILNLDATKAAMYAGIPEKSAQKAGSEFLAKRYIQDTISLAASTHITAGVILRRLVAIMDREEQESVVVNEDGKITVVKVPVSIADSIRAAELLGRYLGMFNGE
jgi:Terminase small subunit.